MASSQSTGQQTGRKPAPRQEITCETCGTVFVERISKRRRFCSRQCGDRATAKRYRAQRRQLTCSHCGKPFTAVQSRHNAEFCSLACRQVAVARRTADKRSEAARAAAVAKPTTYRKIHRRHIHRVVAEQKIGRPLRRGEIVHHKDENRHNNSPDNLEVMTQSKHARLHHAKGHCCTVPGCGRKHAAKGFCLNHWRQWRKRFRLIHGHYPR